MEIVEVAEGISEVILKGVFRETPDQTFIGFPEKTATIIPEGTFEGTSRGILDGAPLNHRKNS